MAAGLVVAADCRHEDAIWTALVDPQETLKNMRSAKLYRSPLLRL